MSENRRAVMLNGINLSMPRNAVMQAAHVRRLRSRARRCESLARVARSYDETMRLMGLRAAYLIEARIAAQGEQAAHHVGDSADNRPDLCVECLEAEDVCPECDAVLCDRCYEFHDCDDYRDSDYPTPSEDAAWAREQDEREAIAATRARLVTSDEGDEMLPW